MRYFVEAVQWLLDPTHWVGPTGAAHLTWQHVWYSLLAVAIASVIGLPLGWWVGHTGRFRGLVVSVTGAARALPTLGVLTLVALLLGLGLAAPMTAFVLLAIPSVLAGAYASIQSVDAVAVDGARAAGMTEWQILTRVEIPLGLPTLVGGIRSALLQVIATATLAAYVGVGGLGRYMFLGLKTRNYPLMLAGSLLVVLLAIICELVCELAQRGVAPAHLKSSAKKVAS